MGIISVFYAALGYLALVAAIFGAMLFLGNGTDIAGMDAGSTAPPLRAAIADGIALTSLALLHLMIARGAYRTLTRHMIPPQLERSTRAWIASAGLFAVLWVWQPMPQIVWAQSGIPATLLSAAFYAGATLVLIATFLSRPLDQFEIPAGPQGEMRSRSFSQTRAPVRLGILICVWSTPALSLGHLLLAAAATGYLLFDAVSRAARFDADVAFRHTPRFDVDMPA